MNTLITFINKFGLMIMLGALAFNIILNIMVLHKCKKLIMQPPIEEYSHRTIDSLRGVNSVLELELNKLDSIRKDVKGKITNLNDTASVALFWELLSE